MNNLQILPADSIDPSILATIRVDAMRPSLEAVGRFDPIRARDRFLASYEPKDTRLIHLRGELAGFFVQRLHSDHIFLDHLYIHPNFQGERLGRKVVILIQDKAKRAGLPLRLMALKESAANKFYQSCGFNCVSTGEFDNHYEWNAK